jgi:hypothetical protein
MRTARFVLGILLAVVVVGVAWRAVRTRAHRQSIQPPSEQQSTTQRANPQQQSLPQAPTQQAGPSAGAAHLEDVEEHLGPFQIAGQSFTVVLRKKRLPEAKELGETVVALEIQDAVGSILYRRTFRYQVEGGTFPCTWSVSAGILAGTNGAGLLVNYGSYCEVSAPEEEPGGWWQVFGVVNGRFMPFSAPLYVEGTLLSQHSGSIYSSAGPLEPRADVMEFRLWTGNFRLVFPVRVDWAQGKWMPAQPCAKTATSGRHEACQYKAVAENEGRTAEMTFVRLFSSPDEKSGKPERVVVKGDSKVEFLAAQAYVDWSEGPVSGPSGSPENPMHDSGHFGVAGDSDVWLKVRIDGKEGWIHTEEDFFAIGLPAIG